MDFRFTPEQEQFRDSVRRFAEKHLAKSAHERAHSPEYPWDVAKLMAGQGLLGITVAEADGGQGGTLIDAVIAIETVASVCPRSADVVQAGNFGPIRVLAEYGTPQQKEKYLKPLLAGESVISVGMTEPEAGSAVTDLETAATAEGVRFGKRSKFMSDEEWAQIYFENVFVPADMVVLKEGGFKKQIAGFNVERIGNAARSLALGRYAYETARRWAMERKQFRRLLCEFQGLQWKFAEMKMKLDAGQLLLYRAAVNADRGFPSAEETAIAKAFCNQAGFDVANEALQVMGGLGYTQEELVEYCLRRCRGWMIAGGSIEILKNRIAESVFERSFPQRPDLVR